MHTGLMIVAALVLAIHIIRERSARRRLSGLLQGLQTKVEPLEAAAIGRVRDIQRLDGEMDRVWASVFPEEIPVEVLDPPAREEVSEPERPRYASLEERYGCEARADFEALTDGPKTSGEVLTD